MKIKRFFSQDMRSAIRMVREELGADAVILSNDRVNGGVEIVAAVDYDETILDRPATPKQNSNRNDKPLTNESSTPQKEPVGNSRPVAGKAAEPVAQAPRPDHRQEPRKQPPAAARKEPNVQFEDFNRAPTEEADSYLDAENFGEDFHETLHDTPDIRNTDGYHEPYGSNHSQADSNPRFINQTANQSSNQSGHHGSAHPSSVNQGSVNQSSANQGDLPRGQHGAPDNTLYDDGYADEEFDADYSDDPYGNQHLSPVLQSKIGSAFNPSSQRKESPYLYRQSDGGTVPSVGRAENTVSNSPADRGREKSAANSSNKPQPRPQDKSLNKTVSQPRNTSEFLTLDEIPADEVKINDTLFDTTQVHDFPSDLANQRNADGKGNYSVWSQEPTLVAMRQEITTLRGMLEQQLNGLAWSDLKKNNPMRAKLIKQLLELGFSPDLSDQVIAAAEGQTDYRRAWQLTLSALAEKLPIKDDDVVLNGGVVALVGATGVGKTTTIAKLAARYALRHGRNSIVLITTDTYRIGALEQLRTYGRILGIPVKIAHNKKQLQDLLRLLGDKKFVLIDTAGMGQRDIRLMEQFSVISDCAKGLKTLLVLSSTTHRAALDETVRTFSNVEINSCILSKLDETSNLGGALSVVAEHQLPVAYISDGQRVPEDLHLARAHTLINRCVTIARRANQSLDNDSLELAYSRMPSHVSA